MGDSGLGLWKAVTTVRRAWMVELKSPLPAERRSARFWPADLPRCDDLPAGDLVVAGRSPA
jgi:hypothetical protein